DPFTLFKEFLLLYNEEEQFKALERYGKITGKYDKETGLFYKNNPPVISCKIGNNEFGILNVIRSSLQFYIKTENNRFYKVWGYDVAGLYENGLEKEGELHLPYYSKVDKSA